MLPRPHHFNIYWRKRVNLSHLYFTSSVSVSASTIFVEFNHLFFTLNIFLYLPLTLFRMALPEAAHGWGEEHKGPFPKMFETNPIMIKLGTVIPWLKNIQKPYKYVTRNFSSANISIFSPEISNFSYIRKER